MKTRNRENGIWTLKSKSRQLKREEQALRCSVVCPSQLSSDWIYLGTNAHGDPVLLFQQASMSAVEPFTSSTRILIHTQRFQNRLSSTRPFSPMQIRLMIRLFCLATSTRSLN